MIVIFKSLDIKTLILMFNIALVLQVFMTGALCFLVKKYQGIKTFALSRIIALISYSLIFSQIKPVSLMVGIGSCLLILSTSLGCLGIVRFTNRTIPLKYLIYYNSLFVLIQAILITFLDIFLYKAIAHSIFQILLIITTIYYLATNVIRGFLESSRFLIAIYSLVIGTLSLRIFVLWRNPPSHSLVPNEANLGLLVFVYIYMLLLTAGFIMMVCQRLYYDLRLAADTDELTQLLNRRAMMQLLERENNYYIRKKQSFAIILLDVDHFKKINDSYGHDEGDRVLVHLAHILHTKLRLCDFVSRWGGEEFLVLLSDTALLDAVNIAERLRSEIEQSPNAAHISITVSMGVAAISRHGNSVAALVTAADHALYAAKKSGRNQVKIAPSFA